MLRVSFAELEKRKVQMKYSASCRWPGRNPTATMPHRLAPKLAIFGTARGSCREMFVSDLCGVARRKNREISFVMQKQVDGFND